MIKLTKIVIFTMGWMYFGKCRIPHSYTFSNKNISTNIQRVNTLLCLTCRNWYVSDCVITRVCRWFSLPLLLLRSFALSWIIIMQIYSHFFDDSFGFFLEFLRADYFSSYSFSAKKEVVMRLKNKLLSSDKPKISNCDSKKMFYDVDKKI